MSDKEEQNIDSAQDLREQIAGLTSEVRELRQLLERLRLQRYVQALLTPRYIMRTSLLSGLFSGLGAVLGATILLTVLVYLLSRLEVVPFIGHFVSEVVKIVQSHQKQ